MRPYPYPLRRSKRRERPSNESTAGYGSQMEPAGPRDKHIVCQFVLGYCHRDVCTFRVGLLAALRSRKLNSQTIGRSGVVTTASHNPDWPDVDGAVLLMLLRGLRGEMFEEEGKGRGWWRAV